MPFVGVPGLTQRAFGEGAHFPPGETVFIIRNFLAAPLTKGRPSFSQSFPEQQSILRRFPALTTFISPRPSHSPLRWLCAVLAVVILVLAGLGSGEADELSSPIVALATVDVEPSDFDLDLPILRGVPSSTPAPWPDDRHEGPTALRPADRTPTPPDRPPCLA